MFQARVVLAALEVWAHHRKGLQVADSRVDQAGIWVSYTPTACRVSLGDKVLGGGYLTPKTQAPDQPIV